MSATLVSKKETGAKETITAKMSRWAAGVSYKQLSQEAVYQAKRFLLDSIGCALGGYQQHDVKIALEVLDEIAGRGLSHGDRYRQTHRRGFGLAGQRVNDSLHGLQRHLLEAGSIASVGYFSRGIWLAASVRRAMGEN